MENNDYNNLKPVESLQNIVGLTPAQRRNEERKKQLPKKPKKQEG